MFLNYKKLFCAIAPRAGFRLIGGCALRLCFAGLLALAPLALYADEARQASSSPISESLPPFISRGGSGGASLKEDVSYLINPALLGFHTRSKGALFYSIRKTRQSGGFSFLDRHTKIPLAVTWQRHWSHSFLKSDRQSVEAATGLMLLPWLAFGLKAKKRIKPSAWNGGLGLAVRLQEGMGLALYGDPVLKEAQQDRRKISSAFYYNWKGVFAFQGDVSFSAKKEWSARGGLESFFQKFFSLRLGGSWAQNASDLSFSGGLSFQTQKALLEYSLEKGAGSWRHGATFMLRF